MDEITFIKLYRKIRHWEWYSHPSTKIVFLHLLVCAQWEAEEFRGIKLEPGQCLFSFRKCAAENGLSVKSVRGSINNLKRTHEVAQHSTHQGTVITLLNWASYQCTPEERAQQRAQQTAHEGHTEGTQRALYKKDRSKEVKKERVIYTQTDEVMDAWNRIAVSCKQVRTKTTERESAIHAKGMSLQEFEEVFARVESSDFLAGRKTDWQATFDWVMKPKNWTKVVEGNYETIKKEERKYNFAEE